MTLTEMGTRMSKAGLLPARCHRMHGLHAVTMRTEDGQHVCASAPTWAEAMVLCLANGEDLIARGGR